MKRDNTVNITIPVYKETMTNNEKASLNQCVKILSSYPITLVCPVGLNLSLYLNEYANFNIQYFDPLYFKNIAGYCKLMISHRFYRRFKAFKYLLVYHLDAWVFRDELNEWCSKGYDYIGAPWFEGWDRVVENAKFLGVGNGGLSLRKVRSHLRFTHNPFLWVKRREIFINLFKGEYSDIIMLVPRMIRRIYCNNLQVTRINYKFHEDNFWSFVVGGNFSSFRIPEINDASLFSFEYNPAGLFDLTGHKLPFACHKWEMNLDFWNRFIRIELNSNDKPSDLVTAT